MREPVYLDPGFSERAFALIESLGMVNWNVIRIGIDRGWLPRKYATGFAAQCLSTCSEDQLEDLSWLANFGERQMHDIAPLLKSLSDSSETVEQQAYDTWRLVFIEIVLDLDEPWEDKAYSLLLVSAMFGDPEDMRACLPVGEKVADEDGNFVDPLDVAARLANSLRAMITRH